MELWIGAVNLGFLYAFMTMGVYITFRIHDFPDITVDGSFTTGAATAAILIVSGVNPFIALVLAFAAGAVAGAITALIHTRLKINGLLAGILVMTGLYSINLHLMGRSNTPLLKQTTVLTYLEEINPGLPMELWVLIMLAVVMVIFWLITSYFFKTDLGIVMRATGNNPSMAAANAVNVNNMKVFGIALANGLVGISGGLVAQYQGFADIGMGIGTILIGLAAVIIGESILRLRSIYARILSVIIGSVIFRLMIAVALYVGMDPIDLKLLTAVFVLATLIISKSFSRKKIQGKQSQVLRFFAGGKGRRRVLALVVIGMVAALVLIGITPSSEFQKSHLKIGILQITDHALLNITRDSFIQEMERIGYTQGKNCTIETGNAHGDQPTVISIIDKYLREEMDIIVPISTPCTQATISRVKDRPVVFATVANPFIIGAGSSDTIHLPNVTGVYGWTPMDKMVEMARQILPDSQKVGAIWDPAHANSVFNVANLQKTLDTYADMTFEGVTITASTEVLQAAQSLVQEDIDVFILSPDNIVYSAFEAVVKAAKPRKVPIFLSDVERLKDGALGALGYDYTNSGIQAAHMVDRIIKGENPGKIPFERYSKLTVGVNLDVAREYNIQIPTQVMDQATMIWKDGRMVKYETDSAPTTKSPKRLALFLFSDYGTIMEVSRAVKEELKNSGMLQKHAIAIDEKNAQGEFYLAQSIAQDIVRQEYDYIITLSTPALQVTANANKKIPHIFGFVTDPYRMGVAENPRDHLPNITGVATFQPVESAIRAMRQLLPGAKKIGIVWNPAEACSEACTEKARESAKNYNFELLEATVSNTNEVMNALNSLLAREIDVFLTSGDNTVGMSVESIAFILKKKKIPYFTNAPSDIDRGAMVGIGADYFEVGRETAKTAVRVINGESPRDIPIKNYAPDKIFVNLALANEYGIAISDTFLAKASKIKRK